MNKEILLKGVLMLGGGYLIYSLLKNKLDTKFSPSTTNTSTKSFDSNTPPPSMENAEIVANAYSEAIKNGEPASRLSELNKECMKDFGLRCYLDKENKLVVCDVSGNVVMTK